MLRLIRGLIAPYRWTLCIVFIAMVIETVMSLAGPWPLKIVLDNVVGSHHLPGWLDTAVKHVAGGAGKMQIARHGSAWFRADRRYQWHRLVRGKLLYGERGAVGGA
jgi:hypothetical protein